MGKAKTKPVRQTVGNGGRFDGSKPGPGRKAGIPNKVTTELKKMILGALADAGGQAYLKRQAMKNPNAFMALLGRVVPQELKADVQGKTLLIVERSYGEQTIAIEQRPETLVGP